MQRRITSLLLALLLLLSLLTGCQHPQENVQTEPSYTEAPTVETTAPATDPTDPTDPTKVTDPADPTDPPATEPPVTQPPATEPPATEPPATEPPATEPPATEPPATQSPATEPPATEPPATEPPATEPPATEPIPESDPYVGMTKAEFYADYHPATSYMDAYYRTQHFFSCHTCCNERLMRITKNCFGNFNRSFIFHDNYSFLREFNYAVCAFLYTL